MKLSFLYYEFEKISSIIKIACCRNTECHWFAQIDDITNENLVDIDNKMYIQPLE